MSAVQRLQVYITHAKSLVWVALLIAIFFGVSFIVSRVFIDFVHGNLHRAGANAIEIMALFISMIGIVAIIGSFLTFTLPQCFQAVVTDISMRLLGRRGQFGVLLALPLTAALAWYCWDYLTPSDLTLGINAGPDWTPYQHGMTVQRYLTMLMVQTPVTLFTLAYGDAAIRGGSWKPAVLAALVLAVAAGVVHGYEMALSQYQFL